MNKIFKSGGRWQVLRKRVSPAVIALQAMAATAAVLLMVMLLKYRSETAPVPAKEFSTTEFSEGNASGIVQLSRTLDPAASVCKNLHAPSEFSLNDMVKIKLPRPMFSLPENIVPEFKALPVAGNDLFTDLRMASAIREKAVTPGTFAVMYDENGKEVARWQIETMPQNGMTVFRIDGSCVLQRSAITSSCGDRAMDQKALNQAAAMRLNPGTYAVCYPQKVRQEI